MRKVFCVEDDVNIRELILYTLNSAGFEAGGFECAADFFYALEKESPDVVLLDIMLPDTDGMEILKRLRSIKKYENLPVIILTAKSERMDKIKGLDNGADDYITKPFDVLELISRIKALLRRCEQPKNTSEYVYKELTINKETRKVFFRGSEITLTYKEFEILLLLLAEPGTVVTRERMLLEVWGTDFEGESRTLDVHIRTLRQKLGDAGEYVETVRNVGYKVG